MKKYDYYCRHLKVLEGAKDEDLNNEFIISGIIDKFSIQFELGWKVLKELLIYEGDQIGQAGSPRSIIKAAYHYFAFMDEEIWLEMLQERNNTIHIYHGGAAKELVRKILDCYIEEFRNLRIGIEERYDEIL